ncbi:MAG: DUF3696 domain-containing protein [Candidatus Sericytochromatia bacterium]
MLEYLHIKRFKTLLNNGFALSHLNLFSGLNGMGKSSVLQMLLLLRQSYENNLLFSKGLMLEGDYLNLGTGIDVLSADVEEESICCLLKWSEFKDSLDFCFDYASEANLQPILKPIFNLENYQTLHSPMLIYNDVPLFNMSFQYLSAERLGPKTNYKLSDFHINTLNTLGNQGEYTAHFLAEKKDQKIPIPSLKHPLAPAQDLLSNVEAWMSEISPGLKIKTVKNPGMNLVSLNYAFVQGKDLTNDYKPQNVGFGLTYALPVVTSILRSRPLDLLLIENPESHLHPAGQVMLGRLCALAATAGVQLLIESHSDHFLNGVRVAVKQGLISPENVKLFFLERSKDSPLHASDVIQPVIDQDGRIDTWPPGFFDEWEQQLDQLL